MVKYFLCGVVPLFSKFEREWWWRPSDFLVMVVFFLMNISRFFFEGVHPRFQLKTINDWWLIGDTDHDDVSWWSSYLSWFYPSFAVLMTMTSGSVCSPFPFNELRTGSKHEWNCSLPHSGRSIGGSPCGIPRWRIVTDCDLSLCQ